MRLFDIFNQGFDDIVVNLQQCYSSLYKNQQDVLEKKKEYTQNLNTYFRNKEYFSKSATGKSILENIETKFQVYQEGFFDFLKKQEKEQDKIQKSISRIYKSNPDLIYLSEYKQFITENKFYELMVTLTKGHQNKLVEKSRLLDLNKFKRIDLKKGSVYVKDNRTHYSDCIVINELNEVLLLKRNKLDSFEAAKYCLPGGHVDDGEDFEYAALRELAEETGIKANAAIYSGDYIDNKIAIHYFTVKVQKDKCNIFLDEREHQQYEWVNINKINEYPLIKNLNENFKDVILIPSWVINPILQPNIINWNDIGEPVSKEIESKIYEVNTIYKSFKEGLIEEEIYKNYAKDNNLELIPFTIYNIASSPQYGLKLRDNIEKSIGQMNCIEYYKQKYGIDISDLSIEAGNSIASNFLEHLYFTKEELENYIKEDNAKKEIVDDKSNNIKGGVADDKSVEDIAKHHNVSSKDIQKELDAGIKVEMEHTNDKEKAEEIAKDHLWEIPDYYTRLDKMESEAEENLSKGFSHKYIRREGVPGNYKYTYPEDLKHSNAKSEPELISKKNSIISEIEETIPKDFKEKVQEFLDNPSKMVRFKIEDVEVFIYDTKINRTPTSTPIFPKYIYLNIDYLSDVPKVILGESSLMIDTYYAYLHELDHIKTKIPPAATPDNWEVYINSPAEKSAMEASDKWLREVSKKAFLQKSEKIEGGLADNKSVEEIAWHHNCSIGDIEDELHMGEKVEMEHTDDKKEAIEIAKDHLWKIPDYYTRLAKMEKEAKEDKLEKGKRAEIGEIREWSGKKMQKTAQGWIPVKDGRQISKEDIQSETKESKPEEQKEEEQYTEEQLSDFAKKTSEQDLKNAASGGNEKLRIAAKKELERRNIEENFKEEQLKVNNVDKKKQLKVILESNPMKDDYHTGIRSEEDILTAEEAFKESIEEGESPTPDFSVDDMKKALKKGSIMIYSSYPIDKGVFVSPSKMEAQAYAGKKEVYSKEIKLDDIAWIDNLQGQFAPTKEIGEVSKKKGNDKE